MKGKGHVMKKPNVPSPGPSILGAACAIADADAHTHVGGLAARRCLSFSKTQSSPATVSGDDGGADAGPGAGSGAADKTPGG